VNITYLILVKKMEGLFQEILTHFSPILKLNHFEKGQLLHQANKVSVELYLVHSGALRSFYYVEGKDVTSHFALDYGVVGPADSIIKRKRSRYNIEALENSSVFVLNYDDMESFLDENPMLERLARQFTQLLYMDLVERIEGMTFLSARERYLHLMARSPDITQRVSLGHIASYLGITQETLSRVRAKH